MRSTAALLWFAACSLILGAAPTFASPKVLDPPKTYCNPMNLDYAFIRNPNPIDCKNHRSTADPVCIEYKGLYYLFSTNQYGYWWSKDLLNWHFIEHSFKENACGDQVCAPAALPTKKGIYFLPCFTERDKMPLYLSRDPLSGNWIEAVDAFPIQTWDPGMFEDNDGKMYIYWGSSNFYPIYGAQIDPAKGFEPIGKTHELLRLNPVQHGWEQFGENNQNGKMDPFIEGAWMNKFGSRYYLQYGAPGTEWNVYGDGVYVSEKPLGPFVYQKHNPFSWKPTGFARGAGHGSTFVDTHSNIWHVATMVISVKNTFERRIGLFPAGVDADGVLYVNTAFGDYPHIMPRDKRDPNSEFTGWMLLSYQKKSWASSSKKEHSTDLAFDEDIKTYWTAEDGKPGQFIAVDLGKDAAVHALQVNYADEEASAEKKQTNAPHRYQIFKSDDGKSWQLLVDKSKNKKEVPHDYVELSEPVQARYVKLVNVEMPTGCFAISDFRVFGKAYGAPPDKVKKFTVERDRADKRNAALKWQSVPGAYAYNVSMGVSKGKLYTSFLVYGDTHYELRSLNVDSPYYFKIQAVGESGISENSEVCAAE